MSVIVIALIGIAIVLLLIVGLRLPPLLGLLIGSLFLLVATPGDLLLRSKIEDKKLKIEGMTSNGLVGLRTNVTAGKYLIWESKTPLTESKRIELKRASSSQLETADSRAELSPANLVWYEILAGDAAISKESQFVAASHVEAVQEARWTGLGGRLADGFGNTFRKLGIPVTMAAIVGICLLQSGAAARLVMAIIALFGARGTAPALTASGFLLGIPVFFDNVFYLLLPLAKSVGRAKPEKMLMAVMAIVVGATMAHSLVPPTPGPLLVVEQVNAAIEDPSFHVGIGMMMLAGIIVGGIAASAGFAYGAVCGRWVRFEPDQLLGDSEPAPEENSKVPLWVAALPIGLPIALLGGSEIVEAIANSKPDASRWTWLNSQVQIVNDPTLVFIGAALASILILRIYGGTGSVGKTVAKGIADAGTIVLITCAGGAFGAALKQLDLANAIGEQFSELSTPWGMLFTAFFLTAIIRFAQGSATVSMVTSSAIVAPLIDPSVLPFHPIYIALAIGCGSKPLPWMNDSGFWQVTTMTGMQPTQTLKSFSVALTIMGLVGFAVTLLGAKFLPLI